MKAMILAAGRGERLRPFTLNTPKPLLRVGNAALIDHALNAIKKAGITDVVINVHYLGDQIIQHCGDGSRYGLCIVYSIEKILLDTGGGVYQALPTLGDEPFLLLSADIWTDFPLQTLLKKSVTDAHLILVENPEYHVNGDFGLDQNNVIRCDTLPKYTYANIGIFHPGLFQRVNIPIFPLRKIILPAIENSLVTGECYHGQWHNVGTVEELEIVKTLSTTTVEYPASPVE